MGKCEYLERVAGISLEGLLKNFHEGKIEYSFSEVERQEKRYFRDSILFVKVEIKSLMNGHIIIPSLGDSFKRYIDDESAIELNAIYNYVIPLTDKIKLDENRSYVLLTDKLLKALDIDNGRIPKRQPIDRIRIYKKD